ncbi:hypothetical protein F66182_10699 [Fusarium sp. NRRL 66182]|nr:hypothetical protein F66182_10699 [Fusarium sp. NRRL 66182]
MARQWILNSQDGFETSLEYQENVPVPLADQLGPTDVLVKMHAGVNGPITPPVVPGCDGAGIVEAVGSFVHEFRPGDRVVTNSGPKIAESRGDDAFATIADVTSMMGQGIHGTLRSMGVFAEKGLVHAPKSLDWLHAATLTCNWPTAYKALFGLKGREAGPGTWVLVQGTGGVSIATLQVAVAAGASVVATTSSEEKAARLRGLGATHTINYRTNPDDWGIQARRFTPEGRGFDIVIDVGGNETLPQSLTAVRVDGQVLMLGQVGKTAENVPMFMALLHTCIVRSFLGGSRTQLKEVIRFIDEKKISPAVDDVVFELAEAKGAYRRLKEKKHFAKVLIRIDHN